MDKELKEHWIKKHKKAFQRRSLTRRNVVKLCDGMKDCVDLYEVRGILRRAIKVWRDEDVCFGDFKKTFLGVWLDMMNCVGQSPHIRITLTHEDEVELSQEVLGLFREVLGDDLELELAMDCSRDEEIARALAEADGDFLPLVPPL